MSQVSMSKSWRHIATAFSSEAFRLQALFTFHGLRHTSNVTSRMKLSCLAVLSMLAVISGCTPPIDGRESSGDKHEWSILQFREYEARQSLVESPEFTSGGEYVLMVVPNSEGSGNIWIMLSPKSPPFYKQMPQGNYRISRDLLNTIYRQRIASSTVEEVLASHVSD